MRVEKTPEIGFCFGVRRAIEMLKEAARECGKLETLGAVVHNEQVLQGLSDLGINVIHGVDEIQGDAVAISSHGVGPQIEAELKAKKVKIIDTTCPSVRRAQEAAQKLSKDGFFVVVFGDAQHAEVKGILGWAGGKGLATLDVKPFENCEKIPRRLGILSQTTQVQENFVEFVKKMVDLALTMDSEIRILDTLCYGTRKRQSLSLDLAERSDLMLVVGGKSSANTRRLFELCSGVTETHWIEKAIDLNPDWMRGKRHIGVTSGTSTPEEMINEVIERVQREASGEQA